MEIVLTDEKSRPKAAFGKCRQPGYGRLAESLTFKSSVGSAP